MRSKTGSIALREADVQPPKTAATSSAEISFCAFSANVGQSDAPSSITGSSCLPSTPPAALICSIASISASFTDTSLIAIVPLSEWRMPTLILSPLTPGWLAVVSPPPLVESEPSSLLPQPPAARAASAATSTAHRFQIGVRIALLLFD